MLDGMRTEQIAVRLSADLCGRLDSLVSRGVYPSRAAAVRAGIEVVAELDRRRVLDDAVARSYTAVPQDASTGAAALDALRRAITEEPW